MKKLMLLSAVLSVALLSGCASVPMESADKDQELKQFPAPAANQAGLYIFREGLFGAALKKTVSVDGQAIGETAPNTYFYRTLTPGSHVLATESEFSDNSINLEAVAGKNHYVRQSIKWGVFVHGARLTEVSEPEGQRGVRNTKLAR